jgi:hypothetical protein
VVHGDLVAYSGGEPVCVVTHLGPAALERATRCLHAVPPSSIRRMAGVVTRSNAFGWVPPQPARRRYAPRRSALAVTEPAIHSDLMRVADDLALLVSDVLPERAEADAATVISQVDEQYLLASSWWTSGVVNADSALLYHTDADNLPAWSAMVVVRSASDGGHLHLADYDVTLACDHGDVVWFPGYSITHAVTPIRQRMRGGWRRTAVFYARRSFAGLAPPTEALRAAQQRQTIVAEGLTDRHRAHGLLA